MKSKKTIKYQSRRFMFNRVFLSIASALSLPVEAALIADPNQTGGPTINTTINGTPQINIANPNSNEISHNKFHEFNVDKNGVVFNNSMVDGVTQIGGSVLKNHQLQNEAKAIISEVTGTNGTNLNGAMEVFGRRADIIVANENGISVNGATTINANNLTLSTGKLLADPDGNFRLAVDKGDIRIHGDGISTDNLGYFDLISRTATLDGQIRGDADIKIVTGQNDYALKDRTHQVRSNSAADKPHLAINASEFGSMYGGRIQLISTESGVGVKHSGSIIASRGIEISADGDLTLAALGSQQNIALRGNNIKVSRNQHGSGGIDAAHDLVINALSHLDINADVFSRNGRVVIDAGTMLQSAARILSLTEGTTAVPAIQINVRGEYTLAGNFYAVDHNGSTIDNAEIVFENGGFVVKKNGLTLADASVLSDTQIYSNNNETDIKAKNLNNKKGTIDSRKNVNLKADNFNNEGFVLTDGTLVIDIKDTINNKGLIIANADLAISGSALSNQGRLTAGKDIRIDLGYLDSRTFSGKNNRGLLDNKGIINANDAMTVKAGNVDNGGLLLAENSAEINTSDLSNTGTVQAKKTKITSNKTISNQGLIHGIDELNLETASLNNKEKGQIFTEGDLDLSQMKNLSNENGSIVAKTINLKNIDKVSNKGKDSIIYAKDGSVSVSHVKSLENIEGAVISSSENLSLENIDSIKNNGSLYATQSLTINSVAQLLNYFDGLIQALDVNLANANLDNSGTILGAENLSISNAKSVINKGNIHSDIKVRLENLEKILNESTGKITTTREVSLVNNEHIHNKGQIASNQSLIISGAKDLINEGPLANIYSQMNVVIDKVNNLVNQDNASLAALDKLVITNIQSLTNLMSALIMGANGLIVNTQQLTNSDSASIQNNSGSADIIAKSIINKDKAQIASGGKLTLTSDDLSNMSNAVIYGENLNIKTDALKNESTIATGQTDGNSINAANLDNNWGKILSNGNLTLDTASLKNRTGIISADYDLNINTKGNITLDGTQGGLSADHLKLNTDGDIRVSKNIENAGSITLSSDKALFVNNAAGILSTKNIYLQAQDIIIGFKSILISMGDLFATAERTIANDGQVLSHNTIAMDAGNSINNTGNIRAKSDIYLDTPVLKNISAFKGGWDIGPLNVGVGYVEYYNGFANVLYNKFSTYYKLPELTSDIMRTRLAEISTSGNLYINQRKEESDNKPRALHNQGGLISAAKNIYMDGDVYNSPYYETLSYYDYIRLYNEDSFKITYFWKVIEEGARNANFYTIDSYLNYIFGNGTPDKTHSEPGWWNSSEATSKKSSFYDSLRNSADTSPVMNQLMNSLFGSAWKNTSYSVMRQKWTDLNANNGQALKDKRYFFVPHDKGEIVAGGNFIHTNGSLNNGLVGSEYEDAMKINEGNNTTKVEINGIEVDTIDSSFNVKVNEKDYAEIAQNGIGSLPSVDDLTENTLLFEKKGLPDISEVKITKDNRQDAIIPLYETRIEMINQEDFHGSDYFFEKIGYEPERPHYVIGDNYFINELIQKSITENLGSFYLIKHGVEGPDLVTMLMDNAGEEISQMEDAPAPGQALTAEQQASLKQDIVWFVEEDVDGIKVMVPRVYLAPESLKEVKSGQVNGTSTLHAGKHFVSDATEVNNINGNISSGGDVHITAEGDFKNIGAGTNAGINSGGKVTVVSEKGNILNSGAAIDGQGDVTLYAKEGDVNLVASSGFDNNGNQDIGKYKDGISSEQKITIFGENITSHGVDIKASNGVDLVATEGSVNLNEVHEVKSDYNNTMDSKNFLNYRQEVTSSVDANSVTTNIDAGSGGMNIQAEKDIVIEGGKFSAKEGSSLVAGNDITIKTSQDHHASESTVDQKEFVFGAQGNAFGHSGEFEHSGLNGNSSSTSSGEYTSTGSDSTIHTGGKKPGAASSGSAGSFEVGLKKHNEHNTLETTTNTNAQFDMGGDLTIKSGGITDIGGMNANADTLDIIAKEVTSTKYEDTVKETHTVKDSFTGVKGEVHSGLLDAANKAANLAIDSGNGQSLNAGATAAQVAGDMSNLIFGDTVIGGSVSAGHERSTNHSEKYSAKENINNINVNNLNIKTEGDTTLNGVKINVQENTNLDIGGDFEINAAKTTSTEMTSNSSHNAGISVGGGIGATGAGVGASLDYSGNQGGSTTSSTKYDNASIDSNNLTLKTGGDAALTGANLNANNADVDVAGDLSITSVQDTLENHADKQNWGGSLGASISSTGVKPVIEGHGGGGSEYRTERVTGEQSGISTSGDLNVKTGGDLNLTGGHIKSDEKKGSVNIGGDINAITLTDSVEQAGLYGGGGGGFGKKGLPTVNGYVDKVEEKHFKEDQHATIDVGGSITGNIKGDLNQDGNNLSTIIQDETVAENNISFTLGAVGKGGKGGKGDQIDGGPAGTYHPKPDTSKPGIGKPDTGKPDTGKPDTGKPDTGKPDTGKPDTGKPDTDKPDTGKPDTDKPDTGKPDLSKPDISKPDTDKTDSGTPDAGKPDSDKPDSGKPDSDKPDAGKPDAGKPDSGKPESGTPDAGKPDSGKPDSDKPDAGKPDSGKPDAGKPDSGTPDSGKPDSGTPDSGKPDAGKPDSGKPDASKPGTDTPDSGKPKTKWPTVQPSTGFIGSSGSAQGLPGGQTGKPHVRPDFNGNIARPGVVNGNGGSTKPGNNNGATKWPEVKTNTDFIGGTGSSQRLPGGQTGKPHDRPDFNGNSARPDGAKANDGVNSANQNAGDKNSGGTQSPEVKTNTDFIGGTGSPSRIPGGQTGKPHDRPDFNGNSARPDGAKANDGVNSANQNAGDKNSGGTQSPEVKTNTDFIGGTGSPSRIPGGQTGKPHDRPDFNGNSARPDGAKANDGVNSANQNAGDKNSGGTQSPEVKTNTDFIGGTGSPSRIPGGQTGKPHDRPDFNGDIARPGAPDKTANLSAPYSHNEWRSLLPETIIFKSDKKMS